MDLPSPHVLVRRGATTLTSEGAATPFALGPLHGLLAAVAACRLVERRVLSFSTLVSECLPARLRAGVPDERSVHDLLLGTGCDAEALLGRCLEVLTGTPLDELIRTEVLAPAGLTDTHLAPHATTTIGDVAHLLALLGRDALIGDACLAVMLERGYGLRRGGDGPLMSFVPASAGEDLVALHYPGIALTVVARHPGSDEPAPVATRLDGV